MPGYKMELDLKTMPVGAAIQQAKIKSGLNNMEIANRMGLTLSVVKKLFAEHQDRLPDIMEVVEICNALGNTFLLDWLAAQVEVLPVQAAASIPGQFCTLSESFANTARATAEAMADGHTSPQEANSILLHAREVRDAATRLMGALEPIAGQMYKGGKWVKVEIFEGRQ